MKKVQGEGEGGWTQRCKISTENHGLNNPSAASLQAGQNNPRVFNSGLDFTQEQHGLTAINQPMVIGQGHVHHGLDDNLSLDGHRPLECAMHTQDGTLRGVDDGRSQERPEHAAVGDGEGTAVRILDSQIPCEEIETKSFIK